MWVLINMSFFTIFSEQHIVDAVRNNIHNLDDIGKVKICLDAILENKLVIVNFFLTELKINLPITEDNVINLMKMNQIEMLELLFRQGVLTSNTKITYSYEREKHNLLQYASQLEYTKTVEMILRSNFIDPSADNNLAIQLAVKNTRYDVIKLLMNDPRVDPNANDNFAITWVMESTWNDNCYDIGKLLFPKINMSKIKDPSLRLKIYENCATMRGIVESILLDDAQKAKLLIKNFVPKIRQTQENGENTYCLVFKY